MVYSPLLAGTYSLRPTYSTLNIGFFPKAERNSLAVRKVLNAGVIPSIVPYWGTKTEICISF
ncbi:hypothetical protein D3C72_2001160 [compost metagenome]